MGKSRIVVLDTHKWVYWVHGDARLRKSELERLRKGKEKVFVPAICLTEIAQLHHRGRIQLGMSVSSWFDVALNYPMVELFPLNASVAAEAYSLPGSFHNDPADRMIVATALLLNADLLTDDALIRRYEGVRTP